MIAYRGPLEIHVGSSQISRAVQEFAQEYGLDSHVWYHDEPLWLIEKNNGDELCRQVQIAAFQTEGGESLYFIPHAYGMVGSDFYTTKPDITERHTFILPLSSLYKNIAIGNEDGLVREIKSFLYKAWDRAAILSKYDLLENLSSNQEQPSFQID